MRFVQPASSRASTSTTRVDVFVGEVRRPTQAYAELARASTARDLDEIVATVPVLMFGVMGRPREELNVVAGALGNAAETHIAPSNYGGHTCTVTPPGLSKWIGVVAYCTQVGLDPERVLAIGDGPNDIELLTNATIAVVPESAFSEALALADHLVAPPDQGGWATVLDLV